MFLRSFHRPLGYRLRGLSVCLLLCKCHPTIFLLVWSKNFILKIQQQKLFFTKWHIFGVDILLLLSFCHSLWYKRGILEISWVMMQILLCVIHSCFTHCKKKLPSDTMIINIFLQSWFTLICPSLLVECY